MQRDGSRRRPPLATKRDDGNAKRIGVRSGILDGDLLFEPGLNAINVEVVDASEVRELLPRQLLGFANLLDSTTNETGFTGHDSRLSESDRTRNALSPIDAQARDSVRGVPRSLDMSRAEVEAWMARLDVDWERAIREAGIPEKQRYVVPDRWGKNPRQMTKIFTALERLEKKRKAPTEDGVRILGLAEWEEIGRALSRVPQVFARELERLRPIAIAATKVAEGEEARATLLSATPAPTKLRK